MTTKQHQLLTLLPPILPSMRVGAVWLAQEIRATTLPAIEQLSRGGNMLRRDYERCTSKLIDHLGDAANGTTDRAKRPLDKARKELDRGFRILAQLVLEDRMPLEALTKAFGKMKQLAEWIGELAGIPVEQWGEWSALRAEAEASESAAEKAGYGATESAALVTVFRRILDEVSQARRERDAARVPKGDDASVM